LLSVESCRAAPGGREIGEKLSRSKGPVTVVIPMQGFAVYDRMGGPLYDSDADKGFVDAISAFSEKFKVVKVDAHVPDPKFIDAVMDAFMENVALARR
jgi:uncharacterized protein (UPF0261 family)